MQDIPIDASVWQLRVVEPPTVKMRLHDDGTSEPVTNRDGEIQFVVALFAKPRASEGQRRGKGEEIRVSLATDPGEGFAEGTVVELIAPAVNLYTINDREHPRLFASAGLWYRADGLTPVGGPSTTSSSSYASEDYAGDLS